MRTLNLYSANNFMFDRGRAYYAFKTCFSLALFIRDEGELVDRIVHLVEKKVIKPPLDVATYPTGLDEKL